MDWLNYHHLMYFWTVARTGSVTAASEELRLASSTISGQIHQLEDNFGQKLFERSGRSLALTQFGRDVFRYADDIFNVGRELMNFVDGHAVGGPLRVHVGVTKFVPKLVVRKLLEPMFNIGEEVHLLAAEGDAEALVADLVRHHLDIVIADAPVGPESAVKAFNYLLADSQICLFGTAERVDPLREEFPQSLDGAPVLLPTSNTVMRRMLDQWFDSLDVYPRVVCECEDAAQLKTFGQMGMGIFPAAMMVAPEIQAQYSVARLGPAGALREKFYAVSIDKKVRNPAVAALVQNDEAK